MYAGVVNSIATSQLQVAEIDPEVWLLCFPHVQVVFLHFPPKHTPTGGLATLNCPLL